MKKILIFLSIVLMPLTAGAQAQIDTKKMKIADFPEKVTKVVLTGSDFYDISLKDEVAARWRLSPYEFCSVEEFEELKTDESLYFLLTTNDMFRKESSPSIQFMTLVKGGEDAEKGIGEMYEVVSMPIASAEDPSGREYVFLPAFLDIIQNHVEESIEKDVVGYSGLNYHTKNFSKEDDVKIVFSEDDICRSIAEEVLEKYIGEDMVITDEDEADEMFSEGGPGTLVSLVVAPSDGRIGSYCYKMLIEAGTNRLVFFRRHKITRKDGPGFLPEDLKKISSNR